MGVNIQHYAYIRVSHDILQVFNILTGTCHIRTESMAEYMGRDMRQRLIRVQLLVLFHRPTHFIFNMKGNFWLIVLIQQNEPSVTIHNHFRLKLLAVGKDIFQALVNFLRHGNKTASVLCLSFLHISFIPRAYPSEDTRFNLWFPNNRHTEECVSAYASLYPLITYYLNRLNDWGLCFQHCKVCGKYFLAKSQRYELCSDKCRKAQALQNKREFDERTRENHYDLLYKNECQNWLNKINRAKNTSGFPADRLENIQAAFADFKKEALQQKRAVKTGTASPKEFTDWLYQQSNVIVELTDY